MKNDLFDIFNEQPSRQPQELKQPTPRKIIFVPKQQTQILKTQIDQNQKTSQKPNIKLYTNKKTFSNCSWERISTDNQSFITKQYKMAKNYNFSLDMFQSQAIICLQANQSVLVCAHTSAGKTAIAQYAIALSFKQNARCIYTSPIKALSNQKYRDLKQQFKDVGLITGDVTLNPNSSCLVMTTEILRNMIYKGNQIVRQVKWVIFDQCHYMRDKQRGVVWEQCIILLPKGVKFLFLSATISNANQFAMWVSTIKQQPCNVVYTQNRPVPLSHYICPSGAQGITLVMNDKRTFLENNFNKAMLKLTENVEIIGMQKRRKKKGNQGSDLQKILSLIIQKNLNPCIVFSFSKKDVEAYATAMVKYDYTTQMEKQNIRQVFDNAIAGLSQQDKNLNQIVSMKPIIQKGIGIHHGGLLPILKQIIQILFQNSKIKVLFSTQTFSMGLNMPARTVVFTSIRKFDGENFRWMGSGQYIQMSGRAGRRGLDKEGISIVMLDQKIQKQTAKELLKGQSDPLKSSFYISYNMYLNSLRLEDSDPQYLIQRSFLQFQHDSQKPQLQLNCKNFQSQMNSLKIQKQKEIQEIYYQQKRSQQIRQKLKSLVMKPQIVLNYFSVGRLVHIKIKEVDWGWGLVVNFNTKDTKIKNKKSSDIVQQRLIVVDVMVHIDSKNINNPKPLPYDNSNGELVVIPFTFDSVLQISKVKIELPKDLTQKLSKNLIKQTMIELINEFGDFPLLKINFPSRNQSIQSLQNLLQNQTKIIKNKKKQFGQKYKNLIQQYIKKVQLHRQYNQTIDKINAINQMVLSKQLNSMNRVLKRAALIDKNSIITLKGNVACQIGNINQLLLTELLFSGYFNDMDAKQITAILSSLVHDQKSSEDKNFLKNQKLSIYFEKLKAYAKNILQTLIQCRIEINEQEYMKKIKEQLIQTTYEWCNGKSFYEISKMTDSYEGSIVRTLKRLDQMLKQLSCAAKVIGNKVIFFNQQLEQKFKQGITYLQRGIVFAASLYL